MLTTQCQIFHLDLWEHNNQLQKKNSTKNYSYQQNRETTYEKITCKILQINNKLMCQYDTDTPAQGPSSPTHKHFAKNEAEKGQ